MRRFFVDADSVSDGKITMTGEDVNHISRVLRLNAGDMVLVCDGSGNEYTCALEEFSADSVTARITDMSRSAGESEYKVTVYQCLPKGDKLDTVIQKCVELGAWRIVPTASARCIVKLNEKDEKKKLVRYNRIAYEAAKQSGRGVIPTVEPSVRLNDIQCSKHDLFLLAYEDERETTLKAVLRENAGAKDIALLIGPEGGLEQGEVDKLCALGAHCVTLGRRILRTETAGMAALAMINYELEG